MQEAAAEHRTEGRPLVADAANAGLRTPRRVPIPVVPDQGVKGKSPARARRKTTGLLGWERAGLPPPGWNGTEDLARKSTGPNDPFRRDHPHAPQAPPARPGREGLHPYRAPGRHPDHRHPRRDRSSRLPQPAWQGAGHRGQVGRPHGSDRDGDLLHGRAELRHADEAAPRATSSRRSPRARADRLAVTGGDQATRSRSRQARPATTFTITKTAAGDVTRTCDQPSASTAAPPARHLVGQPADHALVSCEAGLRARFVVKPSRRPGRRPISPIVFKKRSSSQAAVVGLDLDPGHLAAAEVTVNGSLSLKRGAVAPLRPGILRDGEVADVPALTEALKALWAEHDLPTRVRLGIANQRIVVRTLDLPPLEDDKALAAAVRVEAPDHIPMPMDEAVARLPVARHGRDAGRPPQSRVVVVAVRREMVERFVDATREAGLSSRASTCPPSAWSARWPAAPTPTARRSTSTSPASPTSPSPTPAAACSRAPPPAASTRWSSTLAERRGLTLEHARQWLAHVGLARPARGRRGRRGARRRRARGARGGRAPARRHRPQLAQLLPHAGERRARSSAASSPAPRWPSRASPRRSPSSSACRSRRAVVGAHGRGRRRSAA